MDSTKQLSMMPLFSTVVLIAHIIVGCQSAFLHESCEKNSDCFAELSQCDETYKVCTCRPYSVEYNATTCLQGTLLGFECKTDSQCAIKVPTSGCINGVCSCEDGYVAYRRHTCLAPAKLGEVCFDNQQCNLADKGSHCKYVVPRVFGRCQCQSGKQLDGHSRRCMGKNIKIGQPCEDDIECSTSHAFCQRKLDGSKVCTCQMAYSPSVDKTRCLPTYRGVFSASSLGYSCHSNIQCQLSDPNSICNTETGVCDCAAKNGSCSARTRGCHRSTFQCQSDGKCISWYFLCDGKQDCEDGSDEVCEVREKCPDQAFQCSSPDPQAATSTSRPMPSSNITLISDSTILSSLAAEFEAMRARKMPIKCISRAKLCDGVVDCDNGSDEEGCSGKETCPYGTFQCLKTKECLPEQRFCNAIADCPDQSDEEEQECRMEFQPSEYCPFRCADGRCRSSAIVCSGIQGCSDGSDEQMCQVCRCPRVY